jgi:hypothetical protein
MMSLYYGCCTTVAEDSEVENPSLLMAATMSVGATVFESNCAMAMEAEVLAEAEETPSSLCSASVMDFSHPPHDMPATEKVTRESGVTEALGVATAAPVVMEVASVWAGWSLEQAASTIAKMPAVAAKIWVHPFG